MKLILITLVAVVVGLMVGCESASRTSMFIPTSTPAPAAAPVLSEKLVTGIIDGYKSEGWSHWKQGQGLTLRPTPSGVSPYAALDPNSEAAKVEYHNKRVMAYDENRYPGWHCLYSGKQKELVFRGGYWELMASGKNCDGVEIFRIKDSYDGTVKRVRP